LTALSITVRCGTAAEALTRACRLWLSRVAAGLLVIGIVWNEFFIARYLSLDGALESSTISTIRWQQTLCLLAGASLLLLRSRIIQIVNCLAHRLATSAASGTRAGSHTGKRVIALSLGIPWVILLLVVESNTRMMRFWWLWPLQVVVLAATVTDIPSRLQMPRLVTWTGSLALIFMVAVNPSMLSRLEAGITTGWGGADAPEVQVVDYIAGRIGDRKQATIGYHLIFYGFYATFNAIDSRYRVGADFDLLFNSRHRLSNMNRCAEGISTADEFRIVQTRPTVTDPTALAYINASLDENFRLLRDFGTYKIFQRN
jgi:hypothetical protein